VTALVVALAACGGAASESPHRSITRADLKATPSGPPMIDPSLMPRTAGTKLVIPDEQLAIGARLRGAFKYCIDTDGNVTDVRIVQSTQLPGYDQKIVRTIGAWTFQPVVVDGRPTAVCSVATFLFALH
jgi:TonB family protein